MSAPTSPDTDPAAHTGPPGGRTAATRTPWWTADRRLGLGVGALVLVVAGLLAWVPVIGNHKFYYVGDSQTQFMPTYYRLGLDIRSGYWPALFDVHNWMGGNFVGEALFGTFNPIIGANQVLVSLLPNLALAAAVVKSEFLAFLALGVYLVAREYGAKRWAAAPVAIALPFAGYILYFEAAIWLGGLIPFAFVPYVWWAVRRSARGRLNPIWAFVIGGLAITAGSPYGVLAVAVVIAALLVEFAVARQRRATLRVLALGVCIGLVVPLVFLPLVGNLSVTWRSNHSISNNGLLVPNLSDVLNMSMPTFRPNMRVWGGRTDVPATYFAWFVLPLLPWLDWRALRRRARSVTGPVLFAVVYLLLTVGPSNVWLFRWPLRLIETFWLGIGVLFAVTLSAGLRGDHARRRLVGSGLILLAGTYLAWAVRPGHLRQHVLALLVLAVLTAAAVHVGRRSGPRLAAVLGVGTLVVLVMQVGLVPRNVDAAQFRFPTSVATLKKRFGHFAGPVFEIAPKRGAVGSAAHPALLVGNAFLPTRVEAVQSYTGMGFRPFADYFCMGYRGQVCPRAYRMLFAPTDLHNADLADLMRIRTILVATGPASRIHVRQGWHVAAVRNDGTVIVRDDLHVAWPHGRLSYASAGVQVTGDRNADNGMTEHVRFTSRGGGTLAFARLAWPGYTAHVDGRAVRIRRGPAGLIRIDLPAGVTHGRLTLHWQAPHLRLGLASTGLGLLGALALGALDIRRRRRPAVPPPVSDADRAEPGPMRSGPTGPTRSGPTGPTDVASTGAGNGAVETAQPDRGVGTP